MPIKTDLASLNAEASSAKKSPTRKKKSTRRSRWSLGTIPKPKPKPKPKEDSPTSEKDTSAIANDMEQDNADDSDFDGEVTLNETKELKVMNYIFSFFSLPLFF